MYPCSRRPAMTSAWEYPRYTVRMIATRGFSVDGWSPAAALGHAASAVAPNAERRKKRRSNPAICSCSRSSEWTGQRSKTAVLHRSYQRRFSAVAARHVQGERRDRASSTSQSYRGKLVVGKQRVATSLPGEQLEISSRCATIAARLISCHVSPMGINDERRSENHGTWN